MRVPIPNDWNGDNWACIQIQWPDSDKWRAILAGLLTTPMRGRFWDERTGEIISAQRIGQQIDVKNIPFIPCDGGELPIDGETFVQFIESVESEFAMSLCGYNPKAFKIQNGSLWVRDFCGEWVEIGEIARTDQPLPPDVLDPLGETYYACGKAYAAVDAVYQVVTSAFDEIDNWPNVWVGHVKADCPQFSLAASYITQCIVDCIVLTNTYGSVEVAATLFDASTKESIICALVSQLDDTASVPEDLADIMRNLFNGEFGKQVIDYADVFNAALWAIGPNEIRDVAMLGATNAEVDCGCPEVQLPYNGTIKFDGTWAWGTHTGVVMDVSPTTLQFGKYVRFQMSNDGGDFREARDLVLNLTGAQVGDEITIRQRPYSGVELGTENWEATAPQIDPAVWSTMRVQVSGDTPTETYSSGAGFRQVDATDLPLGTITGVKVNARYAPSTPGVQKTYFWEMEVYAINGVPV